MMVYECEKLMESMRQSGEHGFYPMYKKVKERYAYHYIEYAEHDGQVRSLEMRLSSVHDTAMNRFHLIAKDINRNNIRSVWLMMSGILDSRSAT